MKILFLFTISGLILFHLFSDSLGCTTAIISGSSTPDGRPLLFKHRDSDFEQNRLAFFDDGKYAYIGLLNSIDSLGKEIWAGCNSVGFAIMNSAAYNLNLGDSTKLADQEGIIMKRALQTCASLEDFENMLQTLPKPLGVDANFGVIDIRGGAAYFETGNFSFTKIDANDPLQAPGGYLIRTNFAFSGKKGAGYGYIRYATAADLFYQAAAAHNLTVEFLLRDVSRCLKHSLTEINLLDNPPVDQGQPRYVFFRDFIPRYSSTSSIVIQGLRRGENPGLTTMWTILGFPLCSVAVPVWIAGGPYLPEVVTGQQSAAVVSTAPAPLCAMALRLKDSCFPIKHDSSNSYLNLNALINRQQTGILQKLKPVESAILVETSRLLALWHEQGSDPAKIRKFYNWLDNKIRSEYHDLFNLSY